MQRAGGNGDDALCVAAAEPTWATFGDAVDHAASKSGLWILRDTRCSLSWPTSFRLGNCVIGRGTLDR